MGERRRSRFISPPRHPQVCVSRVGAGDPAGGRCIENARERFHSCARAAHLQHKCNVVAQLVELVGGDLALHHHPPGEISGRRGAPGVCFNCGRAHLFCSLRHGRVRQKGVGGGCAPTRLLACVCRQWRRGQQVVVCASRHSLARLFSAHLKRVDASI